MPGTHGFWLPLAFALACPLVFRNASRAFRQLLLAVARLAQLNCSFEQWGFWGQYLLSFTPLNSLSEMFFAWLVSGSNLGSPLSKFFSSFFPFFFPIPVMNFVILFISLVQECLIVIASL